MQRCEKQWGPVKSPHICDLAKHHLGGCRCTCGAQELIGRDLAPDASRPVAPAGKVFSYPD